MKVNGLHGYYKEYDRASAFELADTLLPDGTPSKTHDIKGTDAPYGLEQHGLRALITDREKLGAGAAITALKEQKVASLIGAIALSEANRLMTKLKAKVSATSLALATSSTPISTLRSAINTFASKNGFLPNRMIICQSMWADLLANEEVTDLMENERAKTLTGEGLAAALGYADVPGASLKVMRPIIPVTKGGTTADLIAGEMLVYFASDDATINDRSAVKCLTTAGGDYFSAVKSRRNDDIHADVLELISYNTHVIAAADSILRFNKA